tara:strand:- start:54 stop:830 length:777 start_codon:yes stop_codon:yes gene_type:complete
MIKLDIKSELPKGIKWTNEMTKQLPYSIAVAMNASVQGSKFVAGSKQKSALNALAGSSRRYLNKEGPPKKQTQTGFRATVANKRNLVTVIEPKDRLWSRNRYLSGNILGGPRAPKYDAAFLNHPQAKNIPSNSRLVPTRYWKGEGKLDKSGNIKKGDIGRLLRQVGTTGRTKTGNIFIGTPRGGGRPPGVYRRERDEVLRPLFRAVTNVNYRPVFPADKVIETSVQKTFGLYLRYELNKNVSKAVAQGRADLRTGLLW